MRRAGIAAFAALVALGCSGFGQRPAWEEPPPPPQEGPVVPAGALHRSVLESGLQVLVLEDRSLPRVAMGLVIPRGAAALPPEQAGLTAYTTELMNRGAGERDALAFAKAVDALGASISAGSGWDTAAVSASGLSRDFDALSALAADVALRPRFEPVEAERLRSQRLAALERAKDDPGTLARWHLARVLFEGHAYGYPQDGTPESVAGFDAAAARRTHAKLFVPQGATFYATGDVDTQRVVERVQELFGTWIGAGGEPVVATPPPPPPAQSRRVVIVNRPDLGQATIVIGEHGISRTAPDRLPVQLLNLVVGGGGFSSRIMSRVREDEGLAYYAYSGFAMRRDGGLFMAATGTRVPEAGRAVGMLLDELERARSDPPSAAEIEHARSLAVGRFSLGLETSDAILSALVDLDVYGLPRDSLDTYRSRLRALTDEEVRAAALAHIHPDRVAIVVVGPPEELRGQLEALGPVEVVEP